jgi:predicted component of type VI protein secretion system
MFEVTVKLGDRLVQKFRGHGETNIGRDPGCELMLDNLGVSRRHAQLREVEGKFLVEDLNSTNGVFVNGRRVTTSEVTPGDEIKIGKFTLILQLARDEPRPAAPDGFDINQTIAMEGMAIPDFAKEKPKFVASVTRDVFHKLNCNWIKATPEGYKVFYSSENEAVQAGKRPCKTCFPPRSHF